MGRNSVGLVVIILKPTLPEDSYTTRPGLIKQTIVSDETLYVDRHASWSKRAILSHLIFSFDLPPLHQLQINELVNHAKKTLRLIISVEVTRGA